MFGLGKGPIHTNIWYADVSFLHRKADDFADLGTKLKLQLQKLSSFLKDLSKIAILTNLVMYLDLLAGAAVRKEAPTG
jgi:hypothetical protein